MVCERLWMSSVEDDRAWLEESGRLVWNYTEDEEEDEDEGERVLVATPVVVYELAVETWRELASGEWTTLYLVEEVLEAKRSLRLAALDPTSSSHELVIASALMRDGAMILDESDATFGEVSCGTLGGAEVAVFGLRFSTPEAAGSFQESLQAACSSLDVEGHVEEQQEPPQVAAPVVPPPPETAEERCSVVVVAKDFEDGEVVKAELGEMGFSAAQIAAALSSNSIVTPVDTLVNWIFEHPVVQEEESTYFFTAEAVESTAWTLVEEAAHATLTAVAFDSSAAVDPARSRRAARSACACARALLESANALSSKNQLDEWWRGVADRVPTIPDAKTRPAAREAAKRVTRAIRDEVLKKTKGAPAALEEEEEKKMEEEEEEEKVELPRTPVVIRRPAESSGERVRELAKAAAKVSSASSRSRRPNMLSPLANLRRSIFSSASKKPSKKKARYYPHPPIPAPPTTPNNLRPFGEWQPPPPPISLRGGEVNLLPEETVRL